MMPSFPWGLAWGLVAALAPATWGVGGDSLPPQAFHSLAELRPGLEAYVSSPRFAGASWSVKIASLDRGTVWFEHHADRRLSPASNTKLYTAALALSQLGGDYRIVTPIVATAAVNGAGELKGDVIVCGRGDPSWNGRRDRRDFWALFEPFVAVFERAGVRHITGELVADATYFHAPPYGAGWTADDLSDDYGAEISAISLEDNYADLRIAPGREAGTPCTIELLQPSTGLVIDNRLTTGSTSVTPQIRVLRLSGENQVRVWGELSAGGKVVATEATVPRPADWFARALREALARRGIRIDGQARGLRWPEAPAARAVALPLGEVTSAPLRELIGTVLRSSQNLESDLIFSHLGELQRTEKTPAWQRADELAVTALDDFLRANALRPDEVFFEEGSGLSRNNLTTAAALVRLLEFMAAHREKDAFISSLPVAATTGTLARRMKGTPAEGNLRAKTGTLRWANALSGYVTTAAGERLVFSLLLNRNVPPPGQNSRDELDEIALMLARYDGRD